MESVLTSFLSIETIVFIIIINLIVMVLRKLVETSAKKAAPIFPDKYEKWWIELWHEWVLRALPALVGGLLAFFVVGYPYPEMFVEFEAGRAFFGVVCGLAANSTYKFFTYYMKKLIPKRVKEEKAKMSLDPEKMDPNGSNAPGESD